MTTYTRPSVFLNAIALLIPLALAGCRGDTGVDDDSGLSDGGDDGTTGDFPSCPNCIAQFKIGYDCGCTPIDPDKAGTVCADDDDDAVEQCIPVCGSDPFTTPMPCAAYADSGSCSSWSPTSQIALIAGTRHVNDTWFAGLINNSAPLWTCDDAYLSPVTGGKFKVQNASTGEFLYVLGLRNNDIPQTLNGMALADYEDVSQAFGTLYLQNSVTNYTLVVRRGTTNVTLLYVLD